MYYPTHNGLTSAHVMKSICDKHMIAGMKVADLTYGAGVFWRLFHRSHIRLHANDLYAEIVNLLPGETCSQLDFTGTGLPAQSFDCVVFDPPFTSAGPSRLRHQARYGGHRDGSSGPADIADVQWLLTEGIAEAAHLSNNLLIVKTQNVVESGKKWPNVVIAENKIVECGFNIIDGYLFNSNRVPQPPGRRRTGLGEDPSVFIVAEKDR